MSVGLGASRAVARDAQPTAATTSVTTIAPAVYFVAVATPIGARRPAATSPPPRS